MNLKTNWTNYPSPSVLLEPKMDHKLLHSLKEKFSGIAFARVSRINATGPILSKNMAWQSSFPYTRAVSDATITTSTRSIEIVDGSFTCDLYPVSNLTISQVSSHNQCELKFKNGFKIVKCDKSARILPRVSSGGSNLGTLIAIYPDGRWHFASYQFYHFISFVFYNNKTLVDKLMDKWMKGASPEEQFASALKNLQTNGCLKYYIFCSQNGILPSDEDMNSRFTTNYSREDELAQFYVHGWSYLFAAIILGKAPSSEHIPKNSNMQLEAWNVPSDMVKYVQKKFEGKSKRPRSIERLQQELVIARLFNTSVAKIEQKIISVSV